MINETGLDSRFLRGLVLAGGEGRRLQSYVQQLRGEELPKQYVNFIGRRSMLEHTFHRAERLIPAEQIFTVISRQHLAHAEVRRQLGARPKDTLIVQPANKETGPGILLPIMFIYKRCPEAIVTVFPSDHFVLEEDRFMNHVRLAAQAVNRDPTRIVLLAVERMNRKPITVILFLTKTSAVLADSEPGPSQRSLKSPEQTWLSNL